MWIIKIALSEQRASSFDTSALQSRRRKLHQGETGAACHRVGVFFHRKIATHRQAPGTDFLGAIDGTLLVQALKSTQ